MRRPHPNARRLLALAAGLALTAGLATPAGAVPSERAAGVAHARAATTAAERAAVAAYWSPARMRAARPADALAPTVTPGEVSTADVARGSASVRPTARPGGGKGKPGGGGGGGTVVTGAEWTGGTAVVATTGKVFFTLGGSNYVCSGSAVTSANESTVLTAGHCLHGGPGAYATNWAFVPAYDDGARPYGTFVATDLYTTSQWASSGDFSYDVGFATVAPVAGATLTDTTGAQGITFSAPRQESRYAFGYPAAKPYDGSDLVHCAGPLKSDPYGADTLGMDCTMTGGSSGGPWLSQFSTSTGLGQLSSVNSYKYSSDSRSMYGPYLGSVAQQLYATASR
ncbi:trypsin-like serine peptidase [Aquipuribacter sp. SD81]|uniref:trypsin-like serine peptidase n=1 Tax=Aquipuribacter sp. SD81 TaxID=3127703 RepID=UPI0030190383